MKIAKWLTGITAPLAIIIGFIYMVKLGISNGNQIVYTAADGTKIRTGEYISSFRDILPGFIVFVVGLELLLAFFIIIGRKRR